MKRKHPKQRHSVILMLLILAFAITAFAHPGRTDSKGGHYDRQNGGYHYHHGYDEHQHPNGVCPYETEDNYYMYDNDYTPEEKKNTLSFDFLVKLSSDFSWHFFDFFHLFACIIAIIIIVRLSFFQKSKLTKSILTSKILNHMHICIISYFAIGILCSLSLTFPYHLSGFEFIIQWLLIGVLVFLLYVLVFSSFVLIPFFIAVEHFYEKALKRIPEYNIVEANLSSCLTPSVADNRLVCEIKRKITEVNKKSDYCSQIIIPPRLLDELNNDLSSKEKEKLLNSIYCEILLQVDSKNVRKEIRRYFRIILYFV